jgi:hypothetical protein
MRAGYRTHDRSDDTEANVRRALRLDTARATDESWAGGIYTCTHHLSPDETTVSNTVFSEPGAAHDHMATQWGATAGHGRWPGWARRPMAAAAASPSSSRTPRSSPVDTTGLPTRLGANDQRQSDLAYEIASDVLAVEPAMSDRTARLAGPSGSVREMIAAGRPLACRSVSGRAAV